MTIYRPPGCTCRPDLYDVNREQQRRMLFKHRRLVRRGVPGALHRQGCPAGPSGPGPSGRMTKGPAPWASGERHG